MNDYSVYVSKEEPGVITALKVLGVLSIIGGLFGLYFGLYERESFIGWIYCLSGVVSGSILMALSKIVEYLYLLVFKEYYLKPNEKDQKKAS